MLLLSRGDAHTLSLGFLMRANQQAKKEVKEVAGEIEADYHEELRFLLHRKAERATCGTQPTHRGCAP